MSSRVHSPYIASYIIDKRSCFFVHTTLHKFKSQVNILIIIKASPLTCVYTDVNVIATINLRLTTFGTNQVK